MNTTVETRTVDLSRFKNAVGLTVTFSAEWGNTRKGNKEKVRFSDDNQEDAKAKARASVGIEKLNSPEYKAIKSYFGDLRTNFIYAKTVPSFFKEGFQLCGLDMIETIEDRLKRAIGMKPTKTDKDGNAIPELPQLVEKFVAAYPAQVEKARQDLEPVGQFRASDYPPAETLRDMFSISWNWIAFSVPDQLPAELRAAEQDKLNRQLTDAAEEITNALREAFAELIKHATEKLTTEPGEKKKTFRDSLIGNIQEFIDSFSSRNLMNDVDLARLVAQAKSVLQGGVTPQKLRDYQSIREDTLNKFQTITAELDKMIVTEPRRKITLDDDDEPKTPEPNTEKFSLEITPEIQAQSDKMRTEYEESGNKLRELEPSLFQD